MSVPRSTQVRADGSTFYFCSKNESGANDSIKIGENNTFFLVQMITCEFSVLDTPFGPIAVLRLYNLFVWQKCTITFVKKSFCEMC